MATRGARAAGGQTANHWAPGCDTLRPGVPGQTAFVQRLRELGWIEGRTIAIEYRWADGRPERFAEIAAEFVRLKVDVIVTVGSVVAALKQATPVIPMVFALANDPVGGGLVASLARPGGNVTGLSAQRLILPANGSNFCARSSPAPPCWQFYSDVGYPPAVLEMGEVQAAARALGIEVALLEIRRAGGHCSRFRGAQGSADALYVVVSTLLANRPRIITLARWRAAADGLQQCDFVQAGGLMSYGPNFPDLFRRAADYVDKILRGRSRPTCRSSSRPSSSLSSISTTAKALGLDVPPTLLARADEVIE